MKQFIYILIVFSFFSCSKKDDTNLSVKNTDIALTTTTEATLEYSLGDTISVEGSNYISSQASNASVSELRSNGIFYYKAKSGFKGTDNVVITTELSDGHSTFALSNLNITITVK